MWKTWRKVKNKSSTILSNKHLQINRESHIRLSFHLQDHGLLFDASFIHQGGYFSLIRPGLKILTLMVTEDTFVLNSCFAYQLTNRIHYTSQCERFDG